ncbi:MAG: hypothetical protein JST16_12175, partial [Bdellovibrionales bacterium]|nr:hypothetical protein [Bdellovibrionales bacterium]
MNTVPTHHTLQEWVLFHVVILALLLLDLGVLNRKAHVIHVKEALGWSAFWIALGLGFGGWINYTLGHQAATEYLTGYVVEKSLSIDNLFVFLVIFRAFSI